MRAFLQDFRFALRTLGKSPAFTFVAVLTLGLGIGMSGMISSVVNGILLQPLPYGEPGRIAMIWSRWQEFPKTWVSLPEFLLYRRDARSFEDIGLFAPGNVNLTGGEEPERVAGAAVTVNLFKVLGTEPVLGRTFTADESVPGRDTTVVLSEGLWRRRFGGDRNVLGSTVEVDGTPRVVVGVMPARYKLPLDFGTATPSEIWWPLAADLEAPPSMPFAGGEHNYYAVGRLRPGVSVRQAGSELREISNRLTASGVYPKDWNFEPLVIPLIDDVLGILRPALMVLLGAVGFVVLIACANVSSLVLAQGNLRRKEFAVRMALGAGRTRLVLQLLTESLILAILGGALGLWLAYLGIDALLALSPVDIPRIAEVGLDGAVLGFTVLVTLSTVVLFGLFPALQLSRNDLQGDLKEAGRGSGAGRRRFQHLLVVTETALAIVLVIAAGLMIRSFWSLTKIDPGFRAENVLSMRLALSEVKYPFPELVTGVYEEILFRIKGVPGVNSVAAVRVLPLASEIGNWGLQVEGYEPPPSEMARGDWQVVTPGYFEVMGIPLRTGRLFTEADRLESQPVIIVSESMARKFWKGENPIGRRIRVLGSPDSPWSTVVGVVGDVRHNGITAALRDTWYLPHAQLHASTGFTTSEMTLVIKGASDPAPLAGPVREEIRALAPDAPLSDVSTLDEIMSRSVSQPRFTMLFLVLCSTLALVLAMMGVYSVMRYFVGLRTWEISLRIALGAPQRRVVGMMVRQGLAMVGAGIVVGVAAAIGLTRFMSSLLYEVGAQDPLTFLLVAALLVLVALGASYLPARRAARVDPVRVLRNE